MCNVNGRNLHQKMVPTSCLHQLGLLFALTCDFILQVSPFIKLLLEFIELDSVTSEMHYTGISSYRYFRQLTIQEPRCGNVISQNVL